MLLLADILVVFPIFIPLPIWLTRFFIQAARKCRIISPADKSTLFYSAPHPHLSTRQAPIDAPNEKNGPTDSKPSATPSTVSSTSPMAVNSMTGDAIEKDEMSEKRYHFPLGLSTAPVVGVFLLLATTSIPGGVVRTGIVGSKGVKPYDIMTLFISLVGQSQAALDKHAADFVVFCSLKHRHTFPFPLTAQDCFATWPFG